MYNSPKKTGWKDIKESILAITAPGLALSNINLEIHSDTGR
jgi:hypothetical protein